jgi:uncharacterized membrane protein
MARPKRRSLGLLFLVIAAAFAGVTAYAVTSGAWIVAVAAGALGVWMGELSYRALR